MANAVGSTTALVILKRTDRLILHACLRSFVPPNDQVWAAADALRAIASRRLDVSMLGRPCSATHPPTCLTALASPKCRTSVFVFPTLKDVYPRFLWGELALPSQLEQLQTVIRLL